MKTRKISLVIAILLIAILACNLPATQVAGPDLVGTYAAQTVAVEQTLIRFGWLRWNDAGCTTTTGHHPGGRAPHGPTNANLDHYADHHVNPGTVQQG